MSLGIAMLSFYSDHISAWQWSSDGLLIKRSMVNMFPPLGISVAVISFCRVISESIVSYVAMSSVWIFHLSSLIRLSDYSPSSVLMWTGIHSKFTALNFTQQILKQLMYLVIFHTEVVKKFSKYKYKIW